MSGAKLEVVLPLRWIPRKLRRGYRTSLVTSCYGWVKCNRPSFRRKSPNLDSKRRRSKLHVRKYYLLTWRSALYSGNLYTPAVFMTDAFLSLPSESG